LLNRLDNVLHVIYLLFSEGYYSQTENTILRKDLCLEAMRLCLQLTAYDKTNSPKTNALLALMSFHASRFGARENNDNEIILYDEQDTALWDSALINQGIEFLNNSAQGSTISSYHLEAGIAYWHCIKEDTPQKWEAILQLYDQLLLINYSPIAALNRAFAIYKTRGAQAALDEVLPLQLTNNHFYFLLLGELYSTIDGSKALLHYEKAYALAKTTTEKEGIRKKINKLADGGIL